MASEPDPDWAAIYAKALRFVRLHFASAISRYGLDDQAMAADATMRTWVTCKLRPDLKPEALIYLMARRVGYDHINRAIRRPVTEALPDGLEIADGSASSDPTDEPEEALMWAAMREPLMQRCDESLRRAAGHHDREVFQTQCAQVASAVLNRGIDSSLYRRYYTQEPILAIWGVLRKVLPEFGSYPATHLPSTTDPMRQRSYRIIGAVRKLLTR